jgi:hypothetical protein
MKKILLPLLILMLSYTSLFSQGEWGFSLGLEWNAYQRYQRPNNSSFAKLSNQQNSAGQLLNALPNLKVGVLLLTGNHHFVILDGGIQFYPYSFDLDNSKGNGALSFPLILSWNLISSDYFIVGLGAGVQFSKMDLFVDKHSRYKDLPNPFFMTYTGEINLGWYDGDYGIASLVGYLRFGVNQYQSHTLDMGIRFQIYGSL